MKTVPPVDRGLSLQNEKAWLIEETWSGYVHYVHRDFDCAKWAAECRRDDDRRSLGLPALMRVPIVTKLVDEAMRFASRDAAVTWLAFQPRWMQGDQYQIREHMWPRSPALEARPLPEGVGGLREAAMKALLWCGKIEPAAWEAHTGEDYSVVMIGDETTDAASIRTDDASLSDFIALANPATILALLDRLAALEAPRPDDGGGEGGSARRSEDRIAPTPQEGRAWRPIESAPTQHGGRADLWVVDNGRGYRIADCQLALNNRPTWIRPSEEYDWRDVQWNGKPEITHWMPLPAPPGDTGSEPASPGTNPNPALPQTPVGE